MTDDDSEDSVNGEGLFAGYEIESAFYDEMFDAAGSPRPHCSRLWEALNGIPPSETRDHAGTCRAIVSA